MPRMDLDHAFRAARLPALAMDHVNTAEILLQRMIEKSKKPASGFFNRMSMQIDFILYWPGALAQFAQGHSVQAGTQKGRNGNFIRAMIGEKTV